QDDGDGQGQVEAVRGEREARAVRDTQREARVTRGLTTESPGPLAQLPARIDTHDLAPAPDQRGEVANDDARAASHLQNPRAGSDRDELQEAPAQPRLRGRPAARLEALRHLVHVRLRVGVSPGVRMGAVEARATA